MDSQMVIFGLLLAVFTYFDLSSAYLPLLILVSLQFGRSGALVYKGNNWVQPGSRKI